MKKYWVQVSLLTAWAFLFLVPILKRGTNIVTNTFAEGSLRYWSGTSPYDPSQVADVFHYSPLFAFLYRPFTLLSSPAHALVWGFLNVLVFWMGISVWYQFGKKTPKMMWVALALCAIELDISQRYQQINAMLVGIVLLSLYFYKKDRLVLSAALLSFITNLKLLPIVFLFLLCWPPKKKFILSAIGFSVLWILIPNSLELHRLQLQAILSDTAGGHGGRSMLDFASTVTRMGYGDLATVLRWITTIVVVCGAVLIRVFDKRVSPGIFYSFVMLSLLVLSPRTESPTFIFLAPAYLFMVEELHGPRKGLVVVLGFFISFVFTSAWAPHFTWTMHQHYYSKVVGTYIFWMAVSITMSLKYLAILTQWNPRFAIEKDCVTKPKLGAPK